jgi:hypothetical protein
MAAPGPNPEFDRLKSVAKALMSQKQWDASSLVALAGSLAGEVNKLTSLSGPQKKQLVLDVVKAVFQEAVEKASPSSPLGNPETVNSLNFVLDFAVPASLDLAVAAARGQLDLKKVKKTAIAGCLACLPFLLKKTGVSAEQAKAIESAAKNLVAEPEPAPVVQDDKSKSQTESTEEKSADTETAQRKNSLSAGVVIRVPEEAPQSEPQSVSVA